MAGLDKCCGMYLYLLLCALYHVLGVRVFVSFKMYPVVHACARFDRVFSFPSHQSANILLHIAYMCVRVYV